MHAQIHSIAFRGIETIAVTVQIHIALGLMVAMGVVPRDAVEDALVLAELALDVAIQPVSGVLPHQAPIRQGQAHLQPRRAAQRP